MKRIPSIELLEKKAKELIEETEAENLASELIMMGARKLIGGRFHQKNRSFRINTSSSEEMPA